MGKKHFKFIFICFGLLLRLALINTIAPVYAKEPNSLNDNKIQSSAKNDASVEVVSVLGMVQSQKANSAEWTAVAIGTKLFSQDKIRTLIDSLAQLKYPDNTTLTLRENSLLTIQDISTDPKTGLSKRELKLGLGGMKYKVSKLDEKKSEFKIHSSTAIVGITGTEGSIKTEGDGKPTFNTLVEGATYNTDENGNNGRPLNPGNTWEIDDAAKTGKHMATDDEKNDSAYKGMDPATEKRFNDFMADFNLKMGQGYSMEPLLKIKEGLLSAFIQKDIAKLNSFLDEAEKIIASLKIPGGEEAREVNEIIQAVYKETAAKQKDGFNLTEVFTLLSKAESYYQQEKYAEARDIAAQVKSTLQTLEKKADDFPARLEQFMNELNSKAKAGFMVNEIVETTKQCKIAYASANRGQAEELLAKAREMLAGARRIIPGELLKDLEALKNEIAGVKNDGFDVADLENLLEQANKAKEAEECFKLEKIIKQLREKIAQGITKTIPPDLLILFNTFEETLKKKEEAGFDLTGLQNLLKTVYEDKDKGDLISLRKSLTQAQDALLKLTPSEQLLKHLQDFKDALKNKKDAGYPVKEIEDLLAQIQSALDKGLIIEARNLLIKAEELLPNLKDTQPPALQAGDLEWTDGDKTVRVNGIAKDNIQIAWVSVNGNLVSLSNSGSFSSELLFTPSLKEIVIEAADTSNNLAPEIRIPIPIDKLAGLEKPTDTTPPELKAEDIRLTYIMPEQLKIDGNTESSAIVIINSNKEVIADARGLFTTQITATAELLTLGLSLISRDANGNASSAVNVKVEDKWPPIPGVINKVELYDTIPPALQVNDLIYDKSKIKVSGTAQDVANVIVAWTETFDFGGLKEYTVNGKSVELNTSCTLPLAKELKSVEVCAIDQAGNKSCISRSVDVASSSVKVTLNEQEVSVDQNGKFSAEIISDANLHELVVRASDSVGNQATPATLVVADIIPPFFNLGDVRYAVDSVEISGSSEPNVKIYDKTQKLFTEQITADANGIFKTKFKRPASEISGQLVAEDLSGNVSAPIELTIKPPLDEKPPLLTVANLNYKDNLIIVSGSAEDDTGIRSLTINGREAELNNSLFVKELGLSPDLFKIEVAATDLSGKTTTVVRVVSDNINPEISIGDLEYDAGYCLVKGTASDNIGLKEVRVNSVPVDIKLPEGGSFEYRLPITADLKNVQAFAIDLYGNYAESSLKTITLPADTTPPTLTLNEITYGSPLAIVSGIVEDNTGIKAVLINGSPVNFYEDGTFKVQLPIQFGMPVLSLNDAVYAEGLVKVSGKVSLGMQDPREINAQAEDLAGNKSDNLKKPVQAVALQDLKVTINDAAVDLQNGSFSIEVPIEKGMTGIKVIAADPYGNNSGAVNVALEKIPPLIKVNDPVYNADSVTISGIATDSGSGISEVLINGAAVALGNDGKFSQTLTIAESTITVAGIDRLGNMATAPPVKLSPPDKNPPVFILKVMPLPAILGKNVFISIEVLDSKTRLPKILPKAPELKVTLPNGGSKNLTVNGAGASFNASLETIGLTAGTINISIKGIDAAGNSGDKNEGISSFLLNTADNIPPALKIMVSPLSPVAAGSNIIIMVSASETLKTLPKTEIILPGGNKFEVFLEGPLSETTFSKSIALPADLPPGEALIRAQNAVDLGGNTQSAAAEFSFMVRPAAAIGGTDLILQIKSQEFTTDKVSIRGLTAANAIVHINAGNIKMDIPADANGRFSFVQTVTREDLEALSKFSSAGFIDLNCYATNYSGAKSQIYSTKLPLPQITTGGAQQGILSIEIQPEQLEQGKSANIIIRSQINLSQPPRALVKLRNGETEPLVLNGAGKEFNAIYQARLNSFLGPALIETRADTYFQTKAFMIIPSGIIMGAGFYGILANPDPGLLGKEIEFTINTQRPAEKAPRLSIRLTNGKVENISLSGQGTEFKGKYLCPANIPPGPSELIINDGEFRRPYGLSSTPSFGAGGKTIYRDVAIYSNPAPMMTGSMAAITVRSGQLFNFIPRTDLRLANGRLIPIPLAGAIPGNNFSGTVNLPMDAPYGPAFIVLKNERNEIIAEHPTNIAPTYTLGPSGDKETEATMMPFSAMPGQTVIININSKRQAFIAMPQAKLIFSNNLILPLRLEGAIPSSMLRSSIVLPAVPPGPVSIAIFDETGKPIGGGAGMITGGMAGPASGDVTINIMPPRPILGNPIDVMISSPAFPLYRLPRVALDTGKGPKELRVDGAIPGNTFRAAAILPKDSAPNSEARVYFDRGAGEETRAMPLNFEFAGGASEGPWPAVITNPDYPVPMQSLMITAHTSSFIDAAPIARVNYIDNSNEIIIMFGAGYTFTGTLAFARLPVKSIEVMDNTGRIRSAKTFAGQNVPIPITGPLPIYPWPVMPGVTETINIDLPMPMPGIPKLNLQLPNGQTIPIFLNGGGTHFSGVFVVPPGTPYGEARLTVEIMGQIFTNFPPIPIGTGFSAGPSNPLQLRLTPGAAGELIVDWNMLANAEKHRIIYSPLIAPGNVKIIDVGRISHFLISGLNPCTEYLVILSARDAKGNEIAKEEDRKNAGGACGGTFTIRASPAGPDGLQLNWDPQPDVNSYELHYALNADPMSGQLRALGNTAAYMLTGLASGNYRIVIEAVRFTGERLKSQEVLGTVGTTAGGAGALIVTPMPPIINQPLNINLQTILPQFSIPYLRFFFSDGETREFALNGGLPGTAFNYNYAMLPKYVNRIEAWDNARTTKLVEIVPGGYYGGSAMMGAMTVTPAPPILGQPLTISASGLLPQQSLPYVIIHYRNFTVNEFLMAGIPGGTNFTFITSPLTNEIEFIEIKDYTRTIRLTPDRNFNSYTSVVSGGTLNVTPDPPLAGAALNINFQPAGAQVMQPYARFFFSDGTMQEFLMNGLPAGPAYTFGIPALTKSLARIEIWDNNKTNKLIEKLFASGGSECWQLSFSSDAPALALTWTVNLNNPCGSPLSVPPAHIHVYFSSGPNLEKIFDLNQITPASFSYTLSAAEMMYSPTKVVAHESTQRFLTEKTVSSATSNNICGYLHFELRPYPPVIGESVMCVVDIPTTQPFLDIRPIVNMRYIDGTTDYITLTSGALPGWNFQGNTVFRNQLQGVDVNIPGKTVCAQAPPTSSDWPNYTIPDASPYPLTPGTAVNFYVNFQYPVPAKPNITATLYNNSGSVLDNFDLIVTGNIPGQFFTGSMAADKWRPGTAKIRIEVENDQFRLLPISREFNINMDYPTGVWEEATAVYTERKIHWNTVPNASGYTIHYGTDAAATLFNKDINNGYTNTDILTGLTSGTVYYYKVTTLGSETSSGIFSFTAGSSVVLDHFYLSAYASLPVNTAATLVVAAKNAANSTIASYVPPSGAVTISYSGVSVTGQTTSLTTANFSLGSAEIHFTPTATGTLQITVSDGNKTSSFTYTVAAATVNHFTLATVPSGVTTRGVGNPVLVKATAYSSADDTTIAAGFNSSAALNVSGSNALISLTDRVTKSTSQLQITNGIGYFTADAFKDGPVNIAVSGYTSNTLSISFTAPTSSELTAKQIAAEYQSQAVTDSDGSSITVFILNSEGKTDPNYTGTITIAITESIANSSAALTKTQGAGSFSGGGSSSTYTFVTTDKGTAYFKLVDTETETISFNISAAPLVPASGSIYFTGVQKFIVEPANPLVRGNSIVLTAWAATNNNRKITSYNASDIPLTNVQEIGGSLSNSKTVPPYINFANGKAAFTISDTEYEQVKFTINGAFTPKSDEITVSFADNLDTSAPVLQSVVADTPYLLHLYFSEEIDSANALRKDNYSNVGAINKVCWYGNDVTLHLAAALSGTASLTVEGTDATGIKDIHGNYMGDKTTSNITVPSNSQGAPYGSGDWLEIQVAPPAVATGTQTVHVTVIQKNACGYLTGSNAINRSTDVSSLSIARGGAYQEKISTPYSSPLSGGQVSFDVTTTFDAAGQSATITVSASGVSSGTATISCSGP